MLRIILTIALFLPAIALAAAPHSLDRITSQRDFDQLRRLPRELAEVRDAPDFVRAKYLSLESREAFFAQNYTRENRRFVLGTIARQPALKGFTHEPWDGDLATTAVISESHQL